jgi:hypothetical protein
VAIVPVFHGMVTGGAIQFLPRERDLRQGWLRSLEGVSVDVVVKPHVEKRSDQQNRWWWGVAVPLIAYELGYDKHELEAVHYALVSKCFGVKPDRLLGEVPNVRSSHLTTVQFSELMEWAVRWAALEMGITVPLPNEVDV